MRIGFFQFAPRFGRPEENLSALAGAVRAARGDLIVAPELALSGYLFTRPEEVRSLAEPIPGPATGRLTEAAQQSGCHLVVGMAERFEDRLFSAPP